MPPSLVCFSHLRWNFVYQRPQHLLSRFGATHAVAYFEEPVFDLEPGAKDELRVEWVARGVLVAVPHLPPGLERGTIARRLQALVDRVVAAAGTDDLVAWYYTPMALPFTRHLAPRLVVYDCMDELSAFKGAPPELPLLERELLGRADVVFTGGRTLYEAKRTVCRNIYAFPSSVDVAHFRSARTAQADPPDQAGIPRPRLGFFGVIDERMDLDLLAGVADARPDWHIVLVGPIVKIDPASLPRRPNLHLLGGKRYEELPSYIAGWDVALLPFAKNESTRFISPTKTPEYLAAGRPVVSTSIRDVVTPYGDLGLVRIADDVPSYVDAIAASLAEDGAERQIEADRYLAGTSWDRTFEDMRSVIEELFEVPITSAASLAVDRTM